MLIARPMPKVHLSVVFETVKLLLIKRSGELNSSSLLSSAALSLPLCVSIFGAMVKSTLLLFSFKAEKLMALFFFNTKKLAEKKSFQIKKPNERSEL